MAVPGVGFSLPSPPAVVIATRNRWPTLATTLEHLTMLTDRGPIIVVDNASDDGTPRLVRQHFQSVSVVALPANLGAAARNVGARLAASETIAFCDDDSWWEPGGLSMVADLLARERAIALAAGCVLVGPDGLTDPVSTAMAAGGVCHRGCPEITGFLACGAAVRRNAFLAVGAFEPALFLGGEEELLALDLAARGCKLVYEQGALVHHHPSPARNSIRREQLVLRNGLLVAWARLPLSASARRTAGAVQRALRQPSLWPAIAQAVARAGWSIRHRQPVSKPVARRHAAHEAGFRAVAAGAGR